jgi:transmembrane sensor
MSGAATPTVGPTVTPDIAAEAAVWVTRLHGPGRSRQMELECLAWQGRSAAHREAFERCTDIWQDVPRVSLANAFAAAEPARRAAGSERAAPPLRWVAAIGVVAALAVGVLGYERWEDGSTFSTGIGEQQLVVLDDGTRMTLNTDTQARVELGSERRTVTVGRGEALFDVAKDAARPFVVRVADSEVVAVGTVFAVRLLAEGGANPSGLDVTLIEGQVTVRPAAGAHGLAPGKPVQMHAGERVRLTGSNSSASAASHVDRPNLEQVVAWRRSEAVFDDTLLVDAVAEMNRYSRTPIVLLDQSGLANLRVSGIYRTGDVAGFASAIAALHGLQSRERDGRLELRRLH